MHAHSRPRFRLRHLDWPVTVAIVLLHVGCVAAPFVFSWSALVVAILLLLLTGPIGITVCYHRLLSHRSFRTPKWFEYVLTTCGCAAGQGGPVTWVGTHRLHHKHSDDEQDPHSPRHGFAWSHVFWCLYRQQVLHWTPAGAARDLNRDCGLRLLDRFHIIPQLVLIAACWLGGTWAAALGLHTSGISWVVWGVCVRTVFVYHSTWFVNSASHTWGYRNYETGDGSTNLWWVAVLSFGEGWHNNHHGDQRAASHGRRWFEFDPTYWIIVAMSWVGLARDIVPTRTAPAAGST